MKDYLHLNEPLGCVYIGIEEWRITGALFLEKGCSLLYMLLQLILITLSLWNPPLSMQMQMQMQMQ